MEENRTGLSKYKQLLRNLLGDNLATWIHASRFAYLLKFTNKLYMEPDMYLLKHFSLRESVVVDVGANSANWTNILSKQVGRTGKVYAFEADPYYAEVTQKTIKLLRLKNVVLFDFGLSDQPEILPLEIFDSQGQRVSGTGRIVQGEQVFGNRTVNVKLETLDQLADIYPNLWNTRLIKCDVEGFELKVFYGAKRIIEEAHPIVIAEVNNLFTKVKDNETIFDFFKNLKYNPYVTVSKNLLRCSWEGGNIPEGQRSNRIFLPQEYQIQDPLKFDQ